MFTDSDKLIECVPNFSDGRNQAIIDAIAAAINSTADVKLMHVDAGYDANRTVYTFAGKPSAVLEAAYLAIKTANELIDMRMHKGEHPRMGACDVCPLIPLHHISMEEVVELSKLLGNRIGNLGIPVYLYEHSATSPERKNLSYLRKGEYESIPQKIQLPEWKPDFGPADFNERFGMMALGARNFLIAYNINLKSKDLSLAKRIALEIRQIRAKNDGSYESCLLQHVKAIGWWMEEYQCTQISINITDIFASPLIEVYDCIKKIAGNYGIEVDGSELIGLVPELTLRHPNRSVQEAAAYLGLDSVKPFKINERVIEYNLRKV
ncbi:MAG: glutamate formimidoyltransferase [Sphingobacteriales bacterium]|nr:glutamate formimidoyltransferase [Sphingobacteriales bacterium]